MYYVYVLMSDKGEHYTGRTSNLRKRVSDHNCGNNVSTRGRQWSLVYYEAYASIDDAMRREQRLKDGRAKKELFKRIEHSLESFVF
jgi:putative endonuclease